MSNEKNLLRALKDLLGPAPLIDETGECRCCGRQYGSDAPEDDQCLFDGWEAFEDNCPGMNARMAIAEAEKVAV